MAKSPLEVLGTNDKELMAQIGATGALAFAEGGALEPKVKYLIAMALDAAHGAPGGVTSLAGQALKAGATREEIMEAMRVVYHICGIGSMFAAAQGLEPVFGDSAK